VRECAGVKKPRCNEQEPHVPLLKKGRLHDLHQAFHRSQDESSRARFYPVRIAAFFLTAFKARSTVVLYLSLIHYPL
jgi:hypothetical protein